MEPTLQTCVRAGGQAEVAPSWRPFLPLIGGH